MSMVKLKINVEAAIQEVEKVTGIPQAVEKAHDLWCVLSNLEDLHDITGTNIRVSDLEYALGLDSGTCVVDYESLAGYNEAHFKREVKKLKDLIS